MVRQLLIDGKSLSRPTTITYRFSAVRKAWKEQYSPAGKSVASPASKAARRLHRLGAQRSAPVALTTLAVPCFCPIQALTVGLTRRSLHRLPWAVAATRPWELSRVPCCKPGTSRCASNFVSPSDSICGSRRTCSMPSIGQISGLQISLSVPVRSQLLVNVRLQTEVSVRLGPPVRLVTFSSV